MAKNHTIGQVIQDNILRKVAQTSGDDGEKKFCEKLNYFVLSYIFSYLLLNLDEQ